MYLPKIYSEEGKAWRNLTTQHSPLGLWLTVDSGVDASGNAKNLTMSSQKSFLTHGNIIFNKIYNRLTASTSGIHISDSSLKLSGDLTIQCLLRINGVATYDISSNAYYLAIISYMSSNINTGITEASNTQYSFGIKTATDDGYSKEALYFGWEYEAGVDLFRTFNDILIPKNETFYVAITKSGTVVSMYINGDLKQSIDFGTQPTGGTTSMYFVIGNRAYGYEPDLSVSNVKLNDRALTANEIKDEFLYCAGLKNY